MTLSLGFSPCPNDTFMMHALVSGKLDNPDLTFKVCMDDVESLNMMALRGTLDVTKVSFHTYLRIRDTYTLLSAGAALGYGCGPLIIARKPLTDNHIVEGPVAIPGEHTTAHLLFRLRHPTATNKSFMVFSEIERRVLSGEVLAGVIIHENRFTYAQKGLVLIEDLGAYWEQQTRSPIPLGAFVARSRLGAERIASIERSLHASIRTAMDDPEGAMPYVRTHAQEMDDEVMRRHIKTYVNSFSLDLGDEGRRALAQLEKAALGAGILA